MPGPVWPVEERPVPAMQVHLAIAPPKSSSRLEWLLEKAVEIGISQITPVVCVHSERRKTKNDRLEKVMIAAAKQSGQLWLPKLNGLERFDKFVRSVDGKTQRFIAFAHTANPHLFSKLAPNADVVVLVGPEGDFSPEELMLAVNYGFKGVSLGQSRLRTETAGIVAVAAINSFKEINT